MSRSRAKGTRGENYFLPRLRKLFYPNYDGPEEEHPLQRAPLKGVNDWGDYLGVPWLHEAKHTIKPLFQQWARTAEGKLGASIGWSCGRATSARRATARTC